MEEQDDVTRKELVERAERVWDRLEAAFRVGDVPLYRESVREYQSLVGQLERTQPIAGDW